MTIIEGICKRITDTLKNVRSPFPQLSRHLLVCSMIRRPGLSVIQSVANITKDLNKLGIPTGSMPDGSANLTIAFTFANINEIFRAFKNDASIQIGIQPYSGVMVGIGQSSAGPVEVTSTNVNAIPGMGMIR